MGGAADVLIGSYDHVLKLRDQGMDVVATGNVEAMYAYALMAKQGSPYSSLDAVRKTKLGTTAPLLDRHQPALRPQAARHRPRPRGRAGVGRRGGPMLAALDHDQIAAGMFLDPLLTQLLGQPDRYQVVHDFRSLEYPLLCVTLRRDWLRANEGTARGCWRPSSRQRASFSPTRASRWRWPGTGSPDIDPAVMASAVQNTLPRLSTDGRISETAHKNVHDQQIFVGALKSPIPYTDAVDLSYLPA